MLDWLTSIANEGIALARVIVILVAIVSVIITYYKTQALVPVVAAAFVAGIAVWAVSDAGIAQLENWIGSDATTSGAIFPAATLRRRLLGKRRRSRREPAASLHCPRSSMSLRASGTARLVAPHRKGCRCGR